jgi:RimJ/RimL family protein N-acetyltransferase
MADLPFFTRWINQPEFRLVLAVRTPYSELAERDWLERIMRPGIPPSDIVFAIDLVENEVRTLIGTMGLHHIDWFNRRAATGSYIGNAQHRGKGYGREAKLALLEYAFNTLDLQKIDSEAFSHNLASQKCLLACGYQQEGVRRSIAFINGQRVDGVMFGITAAEWREQHPVRLQAANQLTTTVAPIAPRIWKNFISEYPYLI